MEDGKSATRLSAKQGAPRVYRCRDGSWTVAHEEDRVAWLGKLSIVPDRTAVDDFELALDRARKMLEEGVAAGAAADAFALFDFRLGESLEALRGALKS